ncbi:MAG: M23 family metallopeptidase [Spirochaetales bacterium]|nr:M23 family metallopeptidase [Spirochaetales bacterium]
MKRFFIFLLFVIPGLSVLSQEGNIHILQKGETLFAISRKYNVSVATLQEFNHINDPGKLQVGAKIKIPFIHVVQKGENLFQISMKYKVDLKSLYALNNLDVNSTLYVGDTILLPKDADYDAAKKYTPEKYASTSSASSIIWPHPGKRTDPEGKLGGITIFANKGDDFISISSGRVIWCATIRGYGYVIIVRTGDNYLYKYSGVDTPYVQFGQIIEPGMKLGTVGENPHDGTAKLLFSVYHNNEPIDPAHAPRG